MDEKKCVKTDEIVSSKELSRIAKEKRDNIIRDFYNQQKDKFMASAEKGYTGYEVNFKDLPDDVQMALKAEEQFLKAIVPEIEMKLRREKLILSLSKDTHYIAAVQFNWN